MGKRKRPAEKAKVEGEFDLPPKHTKAVHLETNKKRLIVILHGAQLETVKVNFVEYFEPFAFIANFSRSATRSSF